VTWTYGGDPSANARDEVRFLVGDTDTTDQLVTDEEIAYAVAQEATNRGAAARVAQALAAKFARYVDKAVGDLRNAYSKRYDQFRTLASELSMDASTQSASAYCGGIGVDDKEAVEEDTDRVEPAFSVGMHDENGHLYENNRDPIDDL
jgi:hypothetical protein